MGVRIEQFDGGEVLYIALDPDGVCARSEFPDELLTVDYNSQGKIIGIEAIGSLAHRGFAAILQTIVGAKEVTAPDDVREALGKAAG